MAKERENPFAAAADKRQAEQEALRRGLEQDTAGGMDQADGGGEETRTKLTLALSVEDKIKLKTIAAQRGITVAKLVHEWVLTLD